MLVGHENAVETFVEGGRGGRLHHAWLLAGPVGVGKRTFADAAARWLLAGMPDDFAVDDEHQAARLLAAGSHMDFRVLERLVDEKGKRKAGIVIDQVRELGPVLQGTPVLGDWRVIIIDSIDDLNPNACNALLKVLEEPAKATVFLLVSHSPARLLPTVRSRCRLVRFSPLPDAAVERVLARHDPTLDDAARAAIVAVAGGAPGAALAWAGLDLAALNAAIERLAGQGGGAVAFARGFGAATAMARFEALCRLVPARIAAAVRDWPSPRNLRLYEEAAALAGSAVAMQMERGQVALALAALLGKIETRHAKVA
ncbi:AAA family ATPase [Sandaracinobacteroides saxicola]|uniref:AAA family ATPase n=1 Tax=Sandaracinobacteroides saxicola TaxID=2759707 RepID=A0A7G5ILR3_9SPHN|nr:AAA family ATPase [Sandaracinobacteroides saxicola]QMW24305.1 AAA family ATPase [Sandaracinobacteroides saxicola]